jgi:hypothetical protein
MKDMQKNLMSMKDSLFYVDDSLIYGKGLFASKYIGAGEIIGVLDGVSTVKEIPAEGSPSTRYAHSNH